MTDIFTTVENKGPARVKSNIFTSCFSRAEVFSDSLRSEVPQKQQSGEVGHNWPLWVAATPLKMCFIVSRRIKITVTFFEVT